MKHKQLLRTLNNSTSYITYMYNTGNTVQVISHIIQEIQKYSTSYVT